MRHWVYMRKTHKWHSKVRNWTIARMEVQTVNNTSLLKNSLLSSTSSSLTSATAKESQLSVSASTGSGSSATSSVSGSTSTSTGSGSGSSAAPSAAAAVAAPHLNNTTTANTANTAITASKTHHSLSISPASSNSEIEKELHDLELNIALNRDAPHSLGDDLKCQSNDSLSGASSVSATGLHCTGNGHVNGNASVANLVGGSDGGDSGVGVSSTHTIVPAAAVVNGNGTAVSNGTANSANSANSATISAQVKKRISSSRTPTRKARRIKFYRNGDRFYPGITIPVSNERYRSFESLFEDVTRLLEENVKIPGAVRTIFTMCGKKICTLDELEDGQSYVCSCNNETFKKIEYNTTSQPLANLTLSNKASNRLSKVLRPSSPLKNGSIGGSGGGGGSSVGGGNISIAGTNGSPITVQLHVVFPRIVTLIRNGTKPRKIMRLLLNKRNSPTFDHVLTAITQVVRLDTYVRKVFTLSGSPVLQLADFFGPDDVFFAYGTERVNYPDDFKLEAEEQKAIQAIRKTLRTAGTTCTGPKPKMPGKSKNIHSVPTNLDHSNSLTIEEVATSSASAGGMINDSGIDMDDLPVPIRERYILGQIIGDGNFAIVLKMKDRQTGLPCALKIIDKSKCKGKEHYIDAEVRVMKKLQHPHIISLIMDVDQLENMFLVLEYVSGGDLFDAITRVTRFSEDQSRVMIRHLASAMAYLHSMCIVHRDIKPENLLVELDGKGNVIELKLADFGLACEVTEPLYAVCGTPTYVAPEILMETGYELKIDVWAAGIILYILLCGFPPFVAPDNEQEPLFDAIIKGVYEFPDPYWSDIGDGVRDLIANMLQSDPKVRFSSEDILDHYWTMGDGDYNDYSS